MARAAVRRRLTWLVATVSAVRAETPSVRTLVLDVPDWPGHLAGQHVDVRLTAEDGYSTERSYSIGSAPDAPLELTVQLIPDGEVSPYLAEVAEPGDAFELRGPVGGYFVWVPDDDPAPVLLAAGGSGVVPLMSMIRAREAAGSRVPVRLLYSVRTPEDVIYADQLRALAAEGRGLEVTLAFTRRSPDPAGAPAKRVDAELLAEAGWPAGDRPVCFVCGPTGFVEAVAGWLVEAGHEPARVRTERFGPTGGT